MQKIVSEIGGIGIYGVVSVCLFFAVFSAAMLLAFLQKKTYLDSMSVLPLESGERRPEVKGRTRDE